MLHLYTRCYMHVFICFNSNGSKFPCTAVTQVVRRSHAQFCFRYSAPLLLALRCLPFAYATVPPFCLRYGAPFCLRYGAPLLLALRCPPFCLRYGACLLLALRCLPFACATVPPFCLRYGAPLILYICIYDLSMYIFT